VGKPERKSPLGISGVECENITEIEWSFVERICLAMYLVLVKTAINPRVLNWASDCSKS
jgi:hypothetical protein